MIIKNKQLRTLMEASVDFDADGEPIEITESDLDNSSFNPANDSYLAMTSHLQGRLTAQARVMRPSHIAIAKLLDTGLKNKDIALRVRMTPQAISNIKHSEPVKELRSLMNKYSSLIAGSTQAMRDNMLYRIAVRNEISDPKVSISAIAEMNKLVHNDRVHDLNKKTGGNATQTVIVQLGDSRLKPSALDEAPAHLIKDVN